MYENYPFWFTFFTKLGYRVVLSPVSNHCLQRTEGHERIAQYHFTSADLIHIVLDVFRTST